MAMKLRIINVKIDCLVALPTGDYALFTASNGRRVWTKNIGYQPGDDAEIHYREGAQHAERVIINGIKIIIPNL